MRFIFSFVVLENIRYMLYQYHAQTALYFGHRFTLSKTEVDHFEGYMAGGGYILSKKALRKLVEDIFPKEPPNCRLSWETIDDLFTGEPTTS